VGAVKAAVTVPAIVNGDIVDAGTARLALVESGADAVMIGRACCGRLWIAWAIDRALQTEEALLELGPMERLSIALEHLEDNLCFYGVALGLRVFRKHLGSYLENSGWISDIARRAARSSLCRLETHLEVTDSLKAFWAGAGLQKAGLAEYASWSPPWSKERRVCNRVFMRRFWIWNKSCAGILMARLPGPN
jgi:tRNA-dihydrouridine synthase B